MERLLVLVRHGQSEWNLKNLFTGWTDVDLSDRGRQEAAEAGLKAQMRYADKRNSPCVIIQGTNELKRGTVVVKDLIGALDSGQLSHAALDALYPEPLPPDNPLWLHPGVTIMPHVARRPTVAQRDHVAGCGAQIDQESRAASGVASAVGGKPDPVRRRREKRRT